MPGVLGHCAPEFVEHPELVAQRLLRYASSSAARTSSPARTAACSAWRTQSIQWAKFRAMAEGAKHGHKATLGAKLEVKALVTPFSGGMGVSPIFNTGARWLLSNFGAETNVRRSNCPFSGGMGASPIFNTKGA